MLLILTICANFLVAICIIYAYIYIYNIHKYIYIYTYKCVVRSSVFYIVLDDSIVSKTMIRRTSAHEENIARTFIVVVVHIFDRHSRHVDMSEPVSRRWRESQC